MLSLARVALVLLASATFSCGGDDSESTEPSQFAPWQEQSLEEREQYMRQVVEPRMRPIFQGFDPDKHASFSCDTCHGDEGPSTDYAMPAVVEPLPLEDTLAYAEELNPEVNQFMLDQVFPVFVELMGEEKFSHDAPDGFRCTRCHQVLVE